MKGFINIIKPEGISSAYAVGAVKKKTNSPCGHMGTLDPMASGVLPVGIGHTSRMFPFLIEKDKTYIAEFRFGVLTDTLDITGNVTETTKSIPTEEEIKSVLPEFIGEIEQVPPKYSSKCISGKRGYQLARAGVDFSLEAKKVKIDNIELIERVSETDFKFRIDCKGGTYIRSLARDIGFKVNSLASMSSLLRSKSGVFELSNGVKLEEFKEAENIEKYIIPAENAVSYQKIILSEKQGTRLYSGVYDEYDLPNGLYRVFCDKEFWGVGEIKDKKIKMSCYVR
ncbi:MAG: tRNA pseudouridine(55) synthase TruB [Firmicutes bacterium]|nr:tRNA pseudouridine(55) synthase TruB [Candidatus Caballimonas caccae]